MARTQGISQFYLHTTRSSTNGMNNTCLFLPSQSWYSFTDPGGMEGWVDLTEIIVWHRKLNPDTDSVPNLANIGGWWSSSNVAFVMAAMHCLTWSVCRHAVRITILPFWSPVELQISTWLDFGDIAVRRFDILAFLLRLQSLLIPQSRTVSKMT